MRYYNVGSGYESMHSLGGYGIICAVISIVVLIDLVLLGVWLWKKIEKEGHHHHHDNH